MLTEFEFWLMSGVRSSLPVSLCLCLSLCLSFSIFSSLSLSDRYALSLPGFGYSSRLRALLASGAVVVHVASADEEFYAPALKHGVHFVRLEHRRRLARVQSVASSRDSTADEHGAAPCREGVVTSLAATLSFLENKRGMMSNARYGRECAGLREMGGEGKAEG
eukprot:3948274-Pleurochrysis_carterae.AAC.1